MTPCWKCIIKLHSKNQDLSSQYAKFFAGVCTFYAKNHNDVVWRHVTSSSQICTKISEKVILPNGKQWCKYEVTSIIFAWIYSDLVSSHQHKNQTTPVHSKNPIGWPPSQVPKNIFIKSRGSPNTPSPPPSMPNRVKIVLHT